MEYTFKLNESDVERRIVLKNDKLIYQIGKDIYDYPYSQINSVWLNKPGGVLTPNYFSCTLNIEHSKPIFISSKDWTKEKKEIIQDNHYNSFVRVLHLHLEEKGRAHYMVGLKPKKYIASLFSVISLMALAIYVVLAYPLKNYLLVIPSLVGIIALIFGLKIGFSRFPSKYRPDSIPLSLLPSQL